MEEERAAVLSLAFVGAVLAGVAHAQPPAGGSVKQLKAVQTDETIVIDGRLDEAAWATAAIIEIEDIHQILPVEYSEPTQQTRFLVLHDEDALYLAADMRDDHPELMTAKVLRQGGNNSWLDDQFNIFLDPFNDKRNGHGVYTWKKTGNSYDGEWQDNNINGHGTLKLANGNSCEGDWEKNAMVSIGKGMEQSVP